MSPSSVYGLDDTELIKVPEVFGLNPASPHLISQAEAPDVQERSALISEMFDAASAAGGRQIPPKVILSR